ncbi:MAG: terminase large subunit domain-containing protein, partial [Bacteroidales bacterium]
MANDKTIIFKPQAGFQEQFVSSNVDFVVGGGVLNCGKTFAAILSVAEPSMDGRFRACFLRNNLGDLKAGGGLISEFKRVYGDGITAAESGDPHVDFPSGARVDLTHISDQSREKVQQRFKGRQYDFIYFDEGTGFTWECFTTVYSRNRGSAAWTGKVRMTTNPKKTHWLRDFLDWYIGSDGFIREDRNGIVRYFFINGATVKDVVWGDSKLEVYEQCKSKIDGILRKVNGNTGKSTYEDVIKSFTFYLGKMSENKASIENNKGYVGSVAVMGGRSMEQNLEGNWNVDPEEEEDIPIPMSVAREVFMADQQRNGDRWVTCDLADYGSDNFVAIAWDGFHIVDIKIVSKSTPYQNSNILLAFSRKHNVAPCHIIFDAKGAMYMKDYIPEAIPYISDSQSRGIDMFAVQGLKTECFYRLCHMVKEGRISFDDEVAERRYIHQNLKSDVSIKTEFVEECSVVRFQDKGSGKKRLMNKKEMNAKLGRGRSMDLLDPIAMRMYPILRFPHGEELIGTAVYSGIDEYDGTENIYDLL